MSESTPEPAAASVGEPPAAVAAPPVPAASAVALGNCANCSAALLGAHCYRCGQPVKGMIRPLSGLIADLVDSVFGFDSRTLRTLLPLYFQPGFLTTEYLAGRRVRYVTPFRLFFFLSVVAFLAVSLVVERPKIETGPANPIDHSTSPLSNAAPGPSAMSFNGKPWDPKTNPLQIASLTPWLNSAINAELARIKPKLLRIKQDPGLLLDKILSLAPQTLMVILPLFALLLKIFYLFQRRYYSEHLIVALHSHSFLCLSILLLVAINAAQQALDNVPDAQSGLGWMSVAVAGWIPPYLFRTQRLVYRQGWFFTTLKFFTIGICYLLLLSLGMLGASLASVMVL